METLNETTRAFGFVNKDAEDLFKAILVIVDTEFQNELLQVMEKQCTNDARNFSSGRISAFNDILRLIQSEREYMLKLRMKENQTNPTQRPLRD